MGRLLAHISLRQIRPLIGIPKEIPASKVESFSSQGDQLDLRVHDNELVCFCKLVNLVLLDKVEPNCLNILVAAM